MQECSAAGVLDAVVAAGGDGDDDEGLLEAAGDPQEAAELLWTGKLIDGGDTCLSWQPQCLEQHWVVRFLSKIQC